MSLKKLINSKTFNIILILISGVMWGTIGLYSTYLTNSGIDSVSITAIRSLLTALMLGIFILFKNPKLFVPNFKDLWSFFGMGVVSFTFFNICYFKSMQYNSLGTACILLYTAPIFVTLMSAVIFKEKITGKKIVCLVLAILGCILVSGIGGGISASGFVFGLLSGFGYALYSIFSVFALKRNNFFTAIFYAFVFATVCLAPFCNWTDSFKILFNDFTALFCIMGMAFFTTVLPYILYTCGLRVVAAGEASVIACVEPLVATLIGLFVFSQSPSLLGLIGMILILIAVIILGLNKSE